LPAFNWLPQKQIFQEINSWWVQCNREGLIPVLAAYGLGKAQRLISGLDSNIGPILTHGAIEKTNQIMRQQKITIPETTIVSSKLKLDDLKNAIVLAPPSALSTSWIKKFGKISTAYASGWMAIRGIKRRRSADKGFVISDHADWAGLNWAIRETEAEKIFVTHGYTESFSKWLRFKGLDASIVKTEFATIEEDI
jgi:putative mRNA 3-end processing factor